MDADERVKSSLIEFSNDLWFNRRLKLDELINHLRFVGQSNYDLQDNITRWIQFFKFLEAECSGSNFTHDKEWSELMNLMQINRKLNHRSVRLRDILKNRQLIESNVIAIRRLNESAKLGQTIESLIRELESMVQLCKLELSSSDGFILAGLSASISHVQDRCQPTLFTLKLELENEVIASHAKLELWKTRIAKQEDTISRLSKFLDTFYNLQSQLMSLKPLMSIEKSPIASSSEKQTVNSIALCKEKFKEVQDFNNILVATLIRLGDKKGCLSLIKLFATKDEDLYDYRLERALNEVESCRNSLDKIMQSLRMEFGRFYFVNDVDLLTIIALDSHLVVDNDSAESKRLISKMFNNSIDGFIISSNTNQLIGVRSPANEVVFLSTEPVPIKKKVNVYSVEIVRILNETIRKLRQTLNSMLMANLNSGEIDWTLPVQLIILAEYVRFCEQTERSFARDQSAGSLLESYELRFKQLSLKQGNCTDWLLSFKNSAVLSLIVHFISTLMALNSQRVTNSNHWLWQKQVRYYAKMDAQILEVCIADTRFNYKFDYLALEVQSADGEPQFKRLISTLITERCFLVASQAVGNLRLGANPYGPAGSGKTETIKALGQLLGCQVIVHNCDEFNDSESLDKLIWGLTHTGLWGCFDEFNRLSSSVLSTVSATLELAQTSIRENKTTVELANGSRMYIDRDSAFFVTLNPADGSKYRGRRQLPANLRNMFLPISMVRVEVDAIVCENLLTLCGQLNKFDLKPAQSLELGRKLFKWIEHMKILQSSCSQCEWDLRLIIAILKRLKMLVSSSLGANSVDIESLLIESVNCEVKPRLANSDLWSLSSSIEQFFGSAAPIESNADCELSADINEQRLALGLNNQLIVQRALDLNNQLETRSGVLLLGPSKSGKSSTWKVLKAAKGDAIRTLVLNPRSCDKLFGYVDCNSRKWIDGLFTANVREALKILQQENAKAKQVWIVLDGPIDPDWIESLNSVLDDNQVLTLSSGERLNFAPSSTQSIKLIFEATNIDFASPATVSRLGLVYHELELSSPIVEKENSKLIIIGGVDKKARSLQMEDLVRGRKSIEYSCSQFSTANHLLDLISSHKKADYFILNNLHLLESEDQWKTKSFIELLRFIATYGGFYDSKWAFITLDARFIITVDALDTVDDRTLSQANIIQIDSIANTSSCLPDMRVIHNETLAEFLGSNKRTDSYILTLSSSVFGSSRREEVVEFFSDCELSEFYDSKAIQQSLKNLDEILKIKSSIKKKKDRLFILTDLECRLMSHKCRSALLHRLNWLKLQPASVKFVYLTHNIHQKNEESDFWCSMGKVYHFEVQTSGNLIEQNLRSILTDTETAEANVDLQQEIDWLVHKSVAFLLDQSVDLRKQKRIDAYFRLMNKFRNKSRSDLMSKSNLLRAGLDRLGDFEQSVEDTKRRCKSDEDLLASKKREMGQLMGAINDSLELARQQKEQIQKLKTEQELKTEEFKAKSRNVEQELGKVQPLIESSKVEILQYLKPDALNEIKTLRAPPKTIKDILDALFILLGVADLSWTSIKSYLSKRSLKDELTNYDFRRKLNEALIADVESKMSLEPESFNLQQATRASKAIVPILGWIIATMRYGKVLVKLKPLEQEMSRLERASNQLAREAENIERKRMEIDAKMSEDLMKLEQLKLEYEELEQNFDAIKIQLNRAQVIRVELDEQINKWRRKLASIAAILDQDQLIKLCAMAASVAVFLTEFHQLKDWMKLFDLNNMKQSEFLSKVLDLLDLEADNSFKSEESNWILQLLMIKLCLWADPFVVPFLDIGKHNKISEQDLIQYLSFKSVLCRAKSVVIVRSDGLNDDWTQSVELALQLNKLVVLELHEPDSQLDIINLVLRKQASGRIILVGQLSRYKLINDLVRPIALPQTSGSNLNNRKDIRLAIMNSLIQTLDPELNKSSSELEFALAQKERDIRIMEANLLHRLASKDSSASIKFDLVKVLSELHQISEDAAKDMSQISVNLKRLQVEQEEYLDISSQATSFYVQFLADLGKSDRFYHMPLSKYIELLMSTEADLQYKGRVNCSVNWRFIAERAMLPMRMECRRRFKEKLESQADAFGIKFDNKKASESEIKGALLNCLQNCSEKHSDKRNRQLLMIVLHEACKSSPQVEVDELHKDKLCCYSKVYATGDKIEQRAQTALAKILHKDLWLKEDPAKVTRCLCIANAHLASNWINTNLLNLMKAAPTEARVLVVLVGEFAVSEDKILNEFDSDVLDYAQVKCWQDELALDLVDRYEILARSAACGLISTIEGDTSCWLMAKQLVLLHVVCQELTKRKSWSKGYTFDYDQLCLALKMLSKLYSNNLDEGSFRLLFSHYLANIVYGSRLETVEDEQRLGRLIKHFLTSSELANQQLAKLERLKDLNFKETNNGMAQVADLCCLASE